MHNYPIAEQDKASGLEAQMVYEIEHKKCSGRDRPQFLQAANQCWPFIPTNKATEVK